MFYMGGSAAYMDKMGDEETSDYQKHFTLGHPAPVPA